MEGDWLLVYQFGGDPPPGEDPSADISDQNIRCHFNGNIRKITQNGNLIENESTFTFVKDEDSYRIIYNQNPDSPYCVYFSDNNTIVIFQATAVDYYFVMRKIQ